jgi:hypothetical protein
MRIFVSYRRDDSKTATGRLCDDLREEFGKNSVFQDIHSVDLGSDFEEQINAAIASSDFVLVVIGSRWVSELQVPRDRDHVRFEVESALGAGARVIPVLVEGAAMPAAAELPATLHPLLRRNALSIDSGRNYQSDFQALVGAIRPKSSARRYPWLVAAAGLAVVATLGSFMSDAWQGKPVTELKAAKTLPMNTPVSSPIDLPPVTPAAPLSPANLFLFDDSGNLGYSSWLDAKPSYASAGDAPRSSVKWTHVVALHNRVLFSYDAKSGSAKIATLDDAGVYKHVRDPEGFVSGWSHIVAVGSDGLFFYDALKRVGQAARVALDGRVFNGATKSDLEVWTHVAGTPSGHVFFYRQSDGVGHTASISSLEVVENGTVKGLAKKWTHITSVGMQRLFLYNSVDGMMLLGEIDPTGNYRAVWEAPSFTKSKFAHIAGASNGAIIMMGDRAPQTATIAKIASNSDFSEVPEQEGFSPPWSHLTAN